MAAKSIRTSRWIDLVAMAAFAIVVLGGYSIVNTASREYRFAGDGLPVVTAVPISAPVTTAAEASPAR